MIFYYIYFKFSQKFQFVNFLALIGFFHLFISPIFAVGPEECEVEHDRGGGIVPYQSLEKQGAELNVGPLVNDLSLTYKYAEYHAQRVQNISRFDLCKTHAYLALRLTDRFDDRPIFTFPEDKISLVFVHRSPLDARVMRNDDQANDGAPAVGADLVDMYNYDFMVIDIHPDNEKITYSDGRPRNGVNKKGPYTRFEMDLFTAAKYSNNPIEFLTSEKLLYPIQYWPLKEKNVEGLFKRIYIDSLRSLEGIDTRLASSGHYFANVLLKQRGMPKVMRLVRLLKSNEMRRRWGFIPINNSRWIDFRKSYDATGSGRECGRGGAGIDDVNGRRVLQYLSHTRLSYLSELLTSCCHATNLRFPFKAVNPLTIQRFFEGVLASGSNIENDIARHVAPDMGTTSRLFYRMYLFMTRRNVH